MNPTQDTLSFLFLMLDCNRFIMTLQLLSPIDFFYEGYIFKHGGLTQDILFSAIKYLDKLAIFSHIHNLSTKEAEVGNSGRRRESPVLSWDTSQTLSNDIRTKTETTANE